MGSIFWNTYTKTLLILFICSFGTFYVIKEHSSTLISFFNWRSKDFWAGLAVMIPAALLFPTLINGFFFFSVMKISDNTSKIEQSIKKQNELLEKLLKKEQ